MTDLITVKSGHVEETRGAVSRAKQQPATRIVVPSKRANCLPALGRRAYQNLGAIGDPAKQQKPVLIALRHDKRFWGVSACACPSGRQRARRAARFPASRSRENARPG